MEWKAPAIKRRKSRQIKVGSVLVGGDAPISVQSMTCTDTMDVESTVAQIKALENAGADIVRVTVPTLDAVDAFAKIVKQVNVILLQVGIVLILINSTLTCYYLHGTRVYHTLVFGRNNKCRTQQKNTIVLLFQYTYLLLF